MNNNTTTSAKNKSITRIQQYGTIAAFALFMALGTMTAQAGSPLAPDPTNLTFTLGYGETNSIAGVQTYVLAVPTNISDNAYVLSANRSWLSVADSTGGLSGTIASGTNKTITVTVFPEHLALGSYTGTVTSGDGWLDVTVYVDIVPGELGLDGLTVKNKKYDGNATATVVSYGTLRGVVSTEDVTLVTSNASAVFRPNGNPDTETKIVYVSGLALAGAQAGNYSINNIRTLAYIMLPSMSGDFDGDRLADPAMMATSGVWKIWLSSAGYAPVTAGPFYVAGSAVLSGDFDGDRLADPAVMTTNGFWVIWLSSVGYLEMATGPFHVAGSTAVTADFDGDRFADPAAVATNGVWKIWLSTANYAPVTTSPFSVTGDVAAAAADFDGDQKADPATMATNGVWKIWLSSAGYAPLTTSPLYVAGGVAPVASDVDGDRLADPAAVAANGVWTIWLSSAGYAPVTTAPLIP